MSEVLIVDCASGTQQRRPLTAEEQAQREADAADALAAEQEANAAESTRTTIRQQVTDHLADLRAITGSSGQLSNAQLSNAVRVLARGQIRLIRLAVGLLDGTD